MSAADKRQQFFLDNFRKENFVLRRAIKTSALTDEIFRNWYSADPYFKQEFERVADEQIVLMRQTLREMATGQHDSAGGLPDKQLLKYFVGEFDKRMGTSPDDDLTADLGDMSEVELESLVKKKS